MPTIYRKKSPSGKILPNWYCSFRIINSEGKTEQIHRSTKRTTKKKAQEAAAQFEEKARNEAGGGDKASRAILAKLTEAGELAMKGRLNPAKAREILADIVKAGGAGEFKSYTLREWVSEWIAAKETSVSKATLSFYRTVTKKFIAFLEDRADAPLESITTAEIRSFRTAIHKKNIAKTANHYVVGLRAMFSDAMSEHATLHNPTDPLKGKALAETDSTERHPFTVEEVSKLVKAAPCFEWEGLILLGAYAGLRIRDAANLTSDNVNDGRIILTPEKTKAKGKTVEIPLHPVLAAHFKQNPPSPFPATPLFPSLDGKVTGGRDGLSTQFAVIQKEAKVPKTRTQNGKQGSLSFHSLRHSFVTWMSNAEVPAEIRKKMSGHSTDAAHAAYTSLEFGTLAAAVAKLPTLPE
ncbi:site-specific integrase [bacterium]|nr:site-specific integrase [bacterium]